MENDGIMMENDGIMMENDGIMMENDGIMSALVNKRPERLESNSEGIINIEGEIVSERRFGNGYCILFVEIAKRQQVTLTGNMPPLTNGMRISANCEAVEHPKYGLQYKVIEISEQGFGSTDAVVDYLASTSFFGIGRVLARRIVDHFGMETIDVLDNTPERLREVDGIGKIRTDQFLDSWKAQRATHQLMTELMGYGMTMGLAMKAYNHFRESSLSIMKENPYRLIEIPGVGFMKADTIALHMGMERKSPNRVKAAILHVLDEALSSGGHCFLLMQNLSAKVLELLTNDVSTFDISTAIKDLEFHNLITVDTTNRVYLTHIYSAEIEVAKKLRDMLEFQGEPLYKNVADLRKDMDELGITQEITLAAEQEQAVLNALNSKVSVITGGPGTGKCLSNSTLIPTPQGLRKMGEIKNGDYVIGSSGCPVKVTGVFPQGVKPVYKMNLDDLTYTECCLDHLWTVQNKRDRTCNKFHTYDTKTIIEKLNGGSRMKRLYIPLAKPANFSHKNLVIDPYLLGLLIGDGSITISVKFTSADDALIQYINSVIPDNLICKLKSKSLIDYSVANKTRSNKKGSNQILNALRFYNLIGCKSKDKFIPKDFLFASIEQRLSLLQGLMDTDGGADGTYASYSTISLQLAKDVQLLAQSLGCKATLKNKNGRYKGKPHHSYRVAIVPPNKTIQLFRLKRKIDMFEYHTKYKPMKAIKSVVYSHEEECTCIYVDVEDHLFCANNFTLTHNTTITRTICQLFKKNGISYDLAAPTGRASKRLSEATGDSAKTIHRLLAYMPGEGFTYNANCPLETDCVLVDESSMNDILLFRSLLSALERNVKLILVGDANQLPSVGPGNVLRDMISSGVIPTVKLQCIFRQSKGSTIIDVAHKILNGEIPILPTPAQAKGKNCMFVSAEPQETVIKYLLTLVGTNLPKIGIKAADIQVLTPMRGKGLGINDLNPRLQEMLNPPAADKTEITVDFKTYRVGDKIMQIRNDYDKSVFNGDIGVIAGINIEESLIYVSYPDLEDLVTYKQSDWTDLQSANAMTVHKSQGAEYPVVIMVLHPSQRALLQRNLFYTGLTRAKKLCIIIGTQGAIETAVNNNKEIKRNTTLSERLRDHIK